MMNTTKRERKLRGFHSLQAALAIEDAKRMPTTPEIERQVDRLYAAGRSKMAAIRYAESIQSRATIETGTIRASIVTMAGDVVKAWLRKIWADNPELQLAFRDCESLSDNDLRALLEDALTLTEGRD